MTASTFAFRWARCTPRHCRVRCGDGCATAASTRCAAARRRSSFGRALRARTTLEDEALVLTLTPALIAEIEATMNDSSRGDLSVRELVRARGHRDAELDPRSGGAGDRGARDRGFRGEPAVGRRGECAAGCGGLLRVRVRVRAIRRRIRRRIRSRRRRRRPTPTPNPTPTPTPTPTPNPTTDAEFDDQDDDDEDDEFDDEDDEDDEGRRRRGRPAARACAGSRRARHDGARASAVAGR